MYKTDEHIVFEQLRARKPDHFYPYYFPTNTLRRAVNNHYQGTDHPKSNKLQGDVSLIVKIKSWPRQVFRSRRALAE